MAATTYHHEKWQAPDDNDDEVLDVVAIQQERTQCLLGISENDFTLF